jgi:RHS repeat-associated protein
MNKKLSAGYQYRSLPGALRVITWLVITSQVMVPFTPNIEAALSSRATMLLLHAQTQSAGTAALTTVMASTANVATPPRIEPPPMRPVFSETPSDLEVFRARVFGEPIVPMARPSTAEENRALAQALLAFQDRADGDDTTAITGFVAQHPESTWRASLLLNLGQFYRQTGYFRKALAAWEEGWNLAKGETERRAKGVADLAFGELVELLARLGRYETLELLFIEVTGRDFSGPATTKITGAREGLWLMRNRPGQAFRCGPLALDRIRAAGDPANAFNERIKEAESATNGLSLVQVCALANELEMSFQMARRSPGARVIIPAVIHWKAGHYAALTKEEQGKYLIQDPTFGDDIWISKAALDEEASGYCAVPAQELPQGWSALSESEAGTVWGKGSTSVSDDDRTRDCDKQAQGCCGGAPMAQYAFHSMLVSLHVYDTPVGYTPSRGAPIQFRVSYKQRDATPTPAHSNFGPKWSFNWVGYIQDSTVTTNAMVEYRLAGGGTQEYNYNSGAPHLFTTRSDDRSHLIRTTPHTYERKLPDGSKEYFDLADSTNSSTRKVYLTRIADASGNTVSNIFDADFRLIYVIDALGKTNAIEYASTNAASALFKRIAKITDRYGRFATFTYNGSDQLTNITDIYGINSGFTYGASDFMTSLTTPYGTTTFEMGESGRTRWLQATDPLGQKEHLRFQNDSPVVGDGFTPTGFTSASLNYRNSFYWDKKAMQAHGTNEFNKARISHWVHSYDSMTEAAGVIESEKSPLEGRIWYSYYGQSQTYNEGTNGKPKQIARVLDDGVTQIQTFEYNNLGKVTKYTDPTNRQTLFTYETNLIDLLEVRQKVGSTNELLAKFTYSTNHLPLTTVDAAGKTNWFTYNAYGQLTAITNALAEVVTMSYNNEGYLTNITGAIAGATTSFTFDGTNRVQTVTDSEGYTVTFEYDALDRPTKITYPDSTYEQIVYRYLDPILHRDRRGHWTHTIYDPLRRVVAVQDALNRVTRFDWCSCGALGSLTDPLGRVTTWMRDLQGRVTEKIYPDLSTVTYTYEEKSSRLKEITDAKGQQTQYNYYIDDNVQSVVYTNSAVITPTVTFTYHSNYNRIETMVDGIGTNTYAYYAVSNTVLGAGQLKSIDGPFASDTITYVYDELGRVKSRDINSVAERATYDALGRVTTLTNILGSFTHNYVNQTFRLSSVTYPNSQTTTFSYYGNTNDQRLETIWHKTSGAATISKFDYTYDADGQIETWTQQADSGTAQVSIFDYDTADQLVGATVRSGGIAGAVLRRYGYGYDKGGNRTGEQIDLGVSAATHNDLNQLTSVSASSGPVKFAGRLSETGEVYVANSLATMGIQNTSFVAYATLSTGTPQVELRAMDYSTNWVTNTFEVTITNNGLAKTLSYDINGNLTNYTTATLTNNYEWDAADRLVKISRRPAGGDWNVTEFTYDGLGRRVRISETTNSSTTTKSFLWCGTEMCEERNSTGGTVNRRFLGQGEQISGTEYVFTHDHLGSIREMINSGGTIQARYEYDPYGRLTKISGSSEADFGYTGHYYQQKSGLHLTLFRAYDADIARWTSRDPLGEFAGVNQYPYGRNNPINLVDPDGAAPTSPTPQQKRVIQAAIITLRRAGFSSLAQELLKKLSLGEILIEPCLPKNVAGEVNPLSDSKYIYLNPIHLPSAIDTKSVQPLAVTLGHEWIHTKQFDDAFLKIPSLILAMPPGSPRSPAEVMAYSFAAKLNYALDQHRFSERLGAPKF